MVAELVLLFKHESVLELFVFFLKDFALLLELLLLSKGGLLLLPHLLLELLLDGANESGLVMLDLLLL